MAPASLAGALVQQNAEALAGIALVQLASPGAPAVYGGFTSNVDMKSGAPAFGTPEYARAVLAGGQLARLNRLPYRSSNANASNAVDAQAGWESAMSLMAAVLGHANIVLHGAGWLEGGLVASFEKTVLDARAIEAVAAMLQAPAAAGPDTAHLGHDGKTAGAATALLDAGALLAAYRPPPLNASISDALSAFVARRREEIARRGDSA